MSKNQLTKQNKHTISNRGDIFYARENLYEGENCCFDVGWFLYV